MPVLKQFTKLNMHQITATSLCAVSVSTAVAAVSYSSQGYANIPIGILLSISAVAASKFGARLNHKLPGKTLSKLLGVAMLISVPFIFLKENKKDDRLIQSSNVAMNGNDNIDDTNNDNVTTITILDKDVKKIAQNKNNNTTATTTVEAGGNNNNNPTRRDEKYYWLGRTAPKSIDEIPDWFKNHWEYSLIGLSVGFISALLGLGGGIITTTYMSLYTDLTQHEAVATSLIAMVPTGLSATYWHMKAGHVHLRTGGILGLASALTMYVAASKIAPHCSEKQLRYAFGSLLLFSATRILI